VQAKDQPSSVLGDLVSVLPPFHRSSRTRRIAPWHFAAVYLDDERIRCGRLRVEGRPDPRVVPGGQARDRLVRNSSGGYGLIDRRKMVDDFDQPSATRARLGDSISGA